MPSADSWAVVGGSVRGSLRGSLRVRVGGWVRATGGLLVAALCSPMLAATGLETAHSQGCIGCHAVDEKVLGPAFVDVAERYTGDAKATSLARWVLSSGPGLGPGPGPGLEKVKP